MTQASVSRVAENKLDTHRHVFTGFDGKARTGNFFSKKKPDVERQQRVGGVLHPPEHLIGKVASVMSGCPVEDEE